MTPSRIKLWVYKSPWTWFLWRIGLRSVRVIVATRPDGEESRFLLYTTKGCRRRREFDAGFHAHKIAAVMKELAGDGWSFRVEVP